MGGFVRESSSDSYVLLGGGGHKLISDFAGASHSHNYLPLSGGTMTGNVFFNGKGIITEVPDYHPTANDLGNLNKPGTFIFAYRNSYAAGNPIAFGTSINVSNDGNTYFQSGRFDGAKTAYNLIFQPAGGNVGIGTTNPTSKLEVYGNVKFNNLVITVDGSDVVFNNDAGRGITRFYYSSLYTFDAQIWSYGYFDLSDIRKKNIIDNVNINIYDIANAPLFKFTWKKENRYSGLHIGTSAQYWKTILPELTAIANDTDQTLSLQYDVAALCSTISIAKKTVEHEQKISYLESQITQLRNEILNLKNTESN